jgi:glycine oxidase
MSESADIIIIGGGVIGLTAAHFLARDGAWVRILERGEFGREASWAGAGIIPPGNLGRASTPIDRLRALSSTLYPGFAEELTGATGIDVGYRRCGGLEFEAPDEPPDPTAWEAEGLDFQRCDDRELRRLEPALADGLGPAYHLPGMAQVRNPRLLRALQAALRSSGMALNPDCPVHEFERDGSRIVAIRSGSRRLTAGQFLIASGAWSEGLLEALGWRPGIRPVRGQIVLLRLPAPIFRSIILEGKGYLVPRDDGRVLVGSTEEEAGFDKRTTPEAESMLMAVATRYVPALARAECERTWAGLRPGSPDGLPFLGRVPGTDNCFVAAGHFRAGLQLAPATGVVMSQLLLGQNPSIPLDAFRLDRTPASPGQGAFRS